MRLDNMFRHHDPIKVKNHMQRIHLNKMWPWHFGLEVILEVKTQSWRDIIQHYFGGQRNVFYIPI
jgi:hypothetical protein